MQLRSEPSSGSTLFNRTRILILTTLFAVLVGVGSLYFAFWRPRVFNSIAVLPLTNAASDPDADYLSEGITDGLINSLSQLPNLTVKSERSVSPKFQPHVRAIESPLLPRGFIYRGHLCGEPIFTVFGGARTGD